MKKTKVQRGFTLIELLVVIAIIGILAAIVLASLSTARGKAQAAKVQGQLDEMRSAAEIYYSSNNGYATNTPVLANETPANSDCTSVASAAGNTSSLFWDSTSGMQNLVSSTIGVTGVGISNIDCGGNAANWSVAAALPGGTTFFCVDSTGKATTASASGVNYTSLQGATGAHAPGNAVACQ